MLKYLKNFFIDLPKRSLKYKVLLGIFILIYALVLSICLIKVDYEMTTPGSLNYTKNIYSITKGNEAGNIYTVGVYTKQRITLFQKLLVQFNEKMELGKYNPKLDLNEKNYTNYSMKMKEISVNKAIIVAYETANKNYPDLKIFNENVPDKFYKYEGLLVTAVLPYANGQVQQFDLITKVNNINIGNKATYTDLVKEVKENEEIKFTVIRDFGKESQRELIVKQTRVKVPDSTENIISTGLAVDDYYSINKEKINTDFQYELNNIFTSLGPSGGAMLALSIYNSLVKDDITKGLNIVGTGTINLDGTIGQIGGVEQKIITTTHYKNINVFFVPGSKNYDDAEKTYNKYLPSFKLIKVNTFEDIINELSKLEVK